MATDDSSQDSTGHREETERIRLEMDGLVSAQRQLNLELGYSAQLGRQFGRLLTGAFLDVAAKGRGLGDVIRSLALGLSRLALGVAFRPLQSLLGNAFQSMLTAPSPFSQTGAVAAPTFFPLAGESGLRLRGAGAATAGAQDASLAGTRVASAPTIVVNVTTPDAESFRRSEAQVAAILARAVGHGQRNL